MKTASYLNNVLRQNRAVSKTCAFSNRKTSPFASNTYAPIGKHVDPDVASLRSILAATSMPGHTLVFTKEAFARALAAYKQEKAR